MGVRGAINPPHLTSLLPLTAVGWGLGGLSHPAYTSRASGPALHALHARRLRGPSNATGRGAACQRLRSLAAYPTPLPRFFAIHGRCRTCRVQVSGDGQQFSMVCADRRVRVFKFGTAKLRRVYDESTAAANEVQRNGGEIFQVRVRPPVRPAGRAIVCVFGPEDHPCAHRGRPAGLASGGYVWEKLARIWKS
jgi:hypothetical protein